MVHRVAVRQVVHDLNVHPLRRGQGHLPVHHPFHPDRVLKVHRAVDGRERHFVDHRRPAALLLRHVNGDRPVVLEGHQVGPVIRTQPDAAGLRRVADRLKVALVDEGVNVEHRRLQRDPLLKVRVVGGRPAPGVVDHVARTRHPPLEHRRPRDVERVVRMDRTVHPVPRRKTLPRLVVRQPGEGAVRQRRVVHHDVPRDLVPRAVGVHAVVAARGGRTGQVLDDHGVRRVHVALHRLVREDRADLVAAVGRIAADGEHQRLAVAAHPEPDGVLALRHRPRPRQPEFRRRGRLNLLDLPRRPDGVYGRELHERQPDRQREDHNDHRQRQRDSPLAVAGPARRPGSS